MVRASGLPSRLTSAGRGRVFWPYAYDDLFDYAFEPYYDGYDGDLFWAYGYDDLFAGVLLPYDGG